MAEMIVTSSINNHAAGDMIPWKQAFLIVERISEQRQSAFATCPMIQVETGRDTMQGLDGE
jgi:hypothetical protein